MVRARSVNTVREEARRQAARRAVATRRDRARHGLPSERSLATADLLTSAEPGRVRDYRLVATDTLARLLGAEQELLDRVIGGMHARFARRRLAAIEAELMVRGMGSGTRNAWRFGVADYDDEDSIAACERFALTREH